MSDRQPVSESQQTCQVFGETIAIGTQPNTTKQNLNKNSRVISFSSGYTAVLCIFYAQNKQLIQVCKLQQFFSRADSYFDLFICCRYAYVLVFPEHWVNQYIAGKLTIGILPITYMCQSFSTWTVVAVALDR